MSTETDRHSTTDNTEAVELRTRAFEILFGDIGGAFVFLVVVAGTMLMWRFSFTINDNYVIANGLAALADGHLYVEEAVYGGSLDKPGMVTADGHGYPRNIGHIVFALPFLVFVKALTAVMAPQVVVAMLWSLVLLGAFFTGGYVFGHKREGRLLGSGIAVVGFLASLALITPRQVEMPEHIALQMSTLVLTAFTSVLLYRVCLHAHSGNVGLAAALAAGLATPALLWATVPKRHAVTAALVIGSLYFLYRSRATDSFSTYRRFRLLAYLPVGLTAWVSVSEGALLFLALVGVDIVTARENSLQSLLGIGLAVFIGSIPFFITNYLISGSPLTSPRMLPDYSPSVPGGTGGGSPDSVRGVTTSSSLPPMVQKIVYFLSWYRTGLEVAITQPDRLYHTFIRSGFLKFSQGPGLALNITFVESMPLAGGLLGAPIIIFRRLRTREFEPIHAVDAFVVIYAILTTLLYIPRLPLFAQLTVRYLYPLFPLAIYGITRLPWVRNVINTRPRWLIWAYTGCVIIGAQLLLAGVVLSGMSVDETMQGFALLSLATATLLGMWSLAEATYWTDNRIGAVLLAIAGAIGTNIILVTLIYFLGSKFALPLIPNL